MRSLEEIIIENNQKAIADIKKLVKEEKSEEYIANYCVFKYSDINKNFIKAYIRELKKG